MISTMSFIHANIVDGNVHIPLFSQGENKTDSRDLGRYGPYSIAEQYMELLGKTRDHNNCEVAEIISYPKEDEPCLEKCFEEVQ